MDAKCSSLHKYAPPSWCFLGSVDRVACLFGLPVDVTGPRGSVTWLRSASAASRRLSRRFFGADAAAWFAGVLLCATQVVQPVQPAVACGCVRLRAVGTGLVLSGCVWLSYGCTGGYSTVIVRFLRNCPLCLLPTQHARKLGQCVCAVCVRFALALLEFPGMVLSWKFLEEGVSQDRGCVAGRLSTSVEINFVKRWRAPS